ncbi:MAG TPA: hypothetical protein VFA20_19255 [Myxococcaceae bacterium]|nr:hypothetical protein [Myxococcaceae bacterium]
MHKTLSAVVVVALAVGGAACGPYSGGGIPNTADVYDITPGASVVIGAGGVAGYGITANTGGVYRLVWNGDQSSSGVHRHFYGSVWSTGTFVTLTRGCFNNVCPVESNDIIGNPVSVTGGQRVDFDAQTADGIDGFDFQTDFEPVYFDLLIDGSRYPSLVFFSAAALGGTVANVQNVPFGLQGT